MPITDGPHETPVLVDSAIPFISAEAMQNGQLNFEARRGFITQDLHELYCRKLRPRRDDVFVCKSGATTGKAAIVETDEPFSVWSPLALVRADRDRILPRFVYQALNAAYVQNQIRTTWSHGTQPNISMPAIGRLIILVPPIPVQRRVLTFLDRETAKIDALIAKKQRLIELLQEKLHFPRKHRTCGDWARRRERRLFGADR